MKNKNNELMEFLTALFETSTEIDDLNEKIDRHLREEGYTETSLSLQMERLNKYSKYHKLVKKYFGLN